MKISLIIIEGAKQIMMTPETNHEKQALRIINPNDELKVVSKWGSFSDKHKHANLQINECQGGYLRVFSEEDSLMFLIKDKKIKNVHP